MTRTEAITAGTKVYTSVRGRRMYGVVEGIDSDHYHSRVNGRRIYRVRWFRNGSGSGWDDADLTVA
jgi:hypothetical protein